MSLLQSFNSEKKVYSKTAVFLCSGLGRPLVGGYMVSKNFKVFGDEEKAKKAIDYSIAFTLLLFCILAFIPNVEKIPKQIIPIFYASVYQGIVLTLQAKQIEAYKKASGKFYGFLHNLVIAIVGLVITFILGIAIVAITSKDSESTKSKTDVQWKTFDTTNYSIQYPENWQIDCSGTMGTSFILLSPLDNDKDKFKENYNLITQDLSGKNIELDQYVKLTEQQIKMFEASKIVESIKIDNINGKCQKIEYTAKQGAINLKGINYIWLIDKKAYVLTFVSEKEKYSEYEDIEKNIFGSFKIHP